MTVRLVPLDQIGPDSRLGRALFNARGQVLAQAGAHLSPGLLQSLERRGLAAVFVLDPLLPDLDLHDAVSEGTRRQASIVVREIFKQADASDTRVQLGTAASVATAILEDLIASPESLQGVAVIRGYDQEAFVHAVNVAIFSLAFGWAQGLRRDVLLKLGAGALLHDLGRVSAPDGEPGQEDPAHTTAGYDLLRRDPAVGSLAAHVALQHHERWDGLGYPRGLKGEEIHLLGRIVAIADAIDTICAADPDRPVTSLWQAARYLAAGRGQAFDPDLVKLAISRLALYPNGTVVRLADGSMGHVVRQSSHPLSPWIRLLGQGTEVHARHELAIVEALEDPAALKELLDLSPGA